MMMIVIHDNMQAVQSNEPVGGWGQFCQKGDLVMMMMNDYHKVNEYDVEDAHSDETCELNTIISELFKKCI